MHRIAAITSITFIIATSFCSGQILNVEKGRLKADSAKFVVGAFGLSFNANNQSLTDDGTGKSFVGLTSNADVGYFSAHHSFLLIGELHYNATSEEDINSAGYGHFRINWLRTKVVSYETFAQIQYDQGRGMRNRRLAGGGLRFRIYREDKSSLFAGIGAMYETEDWEFPGDSDEVIGIELWKSTNYVTSRFQLRENIAIGSIIYFQTGYDPGQDFFRHRVSVDANILVNITSKLAFRTAAGVTYENRPVVPVPKLVYRITNGIQVSF